MTRVFSEWILFYFRTIFLHLLLINKSVLMILAPVYIYTPEIHLTLYYFKSGILFSVFYKSYKMNIYFES